MTNYKKLSSRHRVTEPELPLFFSGKDSLKIVRSVKMPLHRPSMGAVGSGSWVPATTTFSRHLDSLRIGVSLLLLVNLLSLTVFPGPIPYAFHVIIQSSPYSTFDTRSSQICPGLTLIRCTRFSISVTKCPLALLANFNISCVSEYRQFMSQSVPQMLLFK